MTLREQTIRPGKTLAKLSPQNRHHAVHAGSATSQHRSTGLTTLAIVTAMDAAVFDALAQAARTGEPVTLGLISGVKGSSPQKVGAKALFHMDGRIEGTLGGGCLEAEIQQRALTALRGGKSSAFELLLDHDFGWDDGLICGGKVFGLILPNAQNAGEAFWKKLAERSSAIEWGITEDFRITNGVEAEPASWLYREHVTPPCALWIAGAGHVSQAVAPLAAKLDFAVTVFDDRPALASRNFFPPEIELVADTWERLFEKPVSNSRALALLVTRGHRHDALVLRHWIQKPFHFLGMIGSKRKVRIIFDHFLEEKIATKEQLERVACPVGLPLPARTVPEIAVSIMAQFIEQRARLCQTPELQNV